MDQKTFDLKQKINVRKPFLCVSAPMKQPKWSESCVFIIIIIRIIIYDKGSL